MPAGSSKKREQQYEHIKAGLEKSGRSEDIAEEIAARTVNKERARSGEAKQQSRSSTHDISSSRRGGLRSHSGARGRTNARRYPLSDEELQWCADQPTRPRAHVTTYGGGLPEVRGWRWSR